MCDRCGTFGLEFECSAFYNPGTGEFERGDKNFREDPWCPTCCDRTRATYTSDLQRCLYHDD